jgi:hypothetical protein
MALGTAGPRQVNADFVVSVTIAGRQGSEG